MLRLKQAISEQFISRNARIEIQRRSLQEKYFSGLKIDRFPVKKKIIEKVEKIPLHFRRHVSVPATVLSSKSFLKQCI